MKKILMLIISSFLLISPVIAEECTYSMITELSTLGSYIDYTTKYNEDSNTFTVTLYNISEELEIREGSSSKTTTTGQLEYTNLSGGTTLTLKVYSKSTNTCYDQYIRAINISVPYVNPYYNSVLCDGKESLTVCNSMYLDYNISYEIFLKLIEDKTTTDTTTDDEKVEEETTEIDYSEVQSYVIKISLILLSCSLTFIIFNKIYVNTKQKL